MNDGGGLVFGATDGWTIGVIVGMAIVTVIARCFFFILDRPWRLPRWAQRGLQYAPIAALSAVVVPEILLEASVPIGDWRDARLFAAIVGGVAFFVFRKSVLATLLAGMAVYLALHLGIGW